MIHPGVYTRTCICVAQTLRRGGEYSGRPLQSLAMRVVLLGVKGCTGKLSSSFCNRVGFKIHVSVPNNRHGNTQCSTSSWRKGGWEYHGKPRCLLHANSGRPAAHACWRLTRPLTQPRPPECDLPGHFNDNFTKRLLCGEQGLYLKIVLL